MKDVLTGEGLSILKECGKDLLTTLENEINRILKAAGLWLKEGVECFLNDSNQKSSVKVTPIKEEFLKLDRLVEIAKANIVPNSNQIAAILKKGDNSTIIYLAYCKDKELLPEKDNNYVIIEAEGINREIENLFGDNELIILD